MEVFHGTATECHLPYGITQCYLLSDASEVNTPRLNPSHAGRYSIYLPRMEWVSSFLTAHQHNIIYAVPYY